jgi:hypothetical protein
MRKHLVSIVVIVLAIGGLLYAYFGDRGSVSDLERDHRAHLVFPAFRREELQSLEIDPRGALKMRFEASEDDAGEREWRMTLPVGDKGDSVAIDRLLGALEYASYERKVPSGGAGFDSPRVRGSIAMNKVHYAFELGDDATPPDGAAYFRLEGEGVFVIKKDLVNELLKNVDAYRDRSVVPYLSIDLQRFEVGGAKPWAIERVDDISFRIAAPSGNFQGIRASRSGLDKVWQGLAEMRAESFPSVDEATRALGSPLLLTMTPKDSSLPRALLALGGACSSSPDDLVLQRREPTPLVACVPKGALAGISTPLEELVDTHLFAAIPEEVEEISLQALPTGTKIELARKGEGWHQRSPVDRDLDLFEVDMANALVKTVVATSGQVLEPKPPPFSGAFRVIVVRAGTRVQETVDLFDRTARRINDDAVLELSPIAFRRLQPRASAVRSPIVWPESLEGGRVDRLTDDCAGVKQILTRDAAYQFHFETPAELPVDTADAIALAEGIERVRATSWVADSDDGTFGTNKGCSVSITTHSDAGDRGGTIWLGADAGDGEVFARANNDPAVFTVSRAFFDLTKTIMVDRSVFFADAAMIESVDLSRAGKQKHFSLEKNVDAGLEAISAAAAVGELQADAVVHLGPPAPDEGFAKPALDVKVQFTSGDGGAQVLHFTLGATSTRGDQKMIYGRVDGVAATFLLPELKVRPLLDALGDHGP